MHFLKIASVLFGVTGIFALGYGRGLRRLRRELAQNLADLEDLNRRADELSLLQFNKSGFVSPQQATGALI